MDSGLLSKNVTVTTDKKPYIFSDFAGSHAKECYILMNYLWQVLCHLLLIQK